MAAKASSVKCMANDEDSVRVSMTDGERISARFSFSTPPIALTLAISKVLAEVHFIENATGRKPIDALVGPNDLLGLTEIHADGVRIRATDLVDPGAIYLMVSEKPPPR